MAVKGARIDAYLVCGGKCHDFDFARLELLKLLAEDEHVRVKVAQDFGDTEAITAADFLVTYTCDVRPTEAEQPTPSGRGSRAAAGGSPSTAPTRSSIRRRRRAAGCTRRRAEQPHVLRDARQPVPVPSGHRPVPGHGVARAPRTIRSWRASARSRPARPRSSTCAATTARLVPLLETRWTGTTQGFADAEWPDDEPRLVLYRRPLGAGRGRSTSPSATAAATSTWSTSRASRARSGRRIDRWSWELGEYLRAAAPRPRVGHRRSHARRPSGQRMKAGLVTGQRRFELVDVPRARRRSPGTAVVEVALCGICGTDLHGFLSADPYNPAICGHELSGVVVAVGEGVGQRGRGRPRRRRHRAGLRALRPMPRRQHRLLPHGLPRHGRPRPAGPAARRLRLARRLRRRRRLIQVTEGLTDAQAAMIEPATVALHAVHRTGRAPRRHRRRPGLRPDRPPHPAVRQGQRRGPAHRRRAQRRPPGTGSRRSAPTRR